MEVDGKQTGLTRSNSSTRDMELGHRQCPPQHCPSPDSLLHTLVRKASPLLVGIAGHGAIRSLSTKNFDPEALRPQPHAARSHHGYASAPTPSEPDRVLLLSCYAELRPPPLPPRAVRQRQPNGGRARTRAENCRHVLALFTPQEPAEQTFALSSSRRST